MKATLSLSLTLLLLGVGVNRLCLGQPTQTPSATASDSAKSRSEQHDTTRNTALLATPKLENDFYDWYERHQQVLDEVSRRKADLVFIGDSITHMFGGLPKPNRSHGQAVWDEFYTPRNALNLGFGFDRIQNVLWRIDHGELAGQTPRVAVIMIGTNNFHRSANARDNTEAEIVEGITAICEKVHQITPTTRVLLLGIFPRGASPEYAHRSRIKTINAELSKLPEQRSWLTFLDIGEKFLQADGTISKDIMYDALHPTSAGYRVWAEAMEPTLRKLWDQSDS